MKSACRRGLGAFAAIVATLVVAPSAEATINSALGVSCSVQGDGVRFCGSSSPRSTTPTWDGTPIDVNIAFPPEPASGPDGNFPLVMLFHGYGGDKIGLSGMERWLDRGYATFSMTNRGFHESCGSAAAQAAGGAECADGYVRLIDNRFEVRDAQEFAGRLADEGVGLVDPQRIGAIGGSYGGGMSMALGALKNRKVLPDGSLVAWTSPAGKPMQIAATAPNIPWTDLAYSLVPNGSTLDYVADAPYSGPIGVQKQSLITGLYLSGLSAPGYYSAPGTDPSADLTGWRERLEAGEPYGADTQAILDEITTNHSSYYIDDSIEPAPMLMSSGFTDDLFPADETIRYYNRTKGTYPDADLALYFGDFGHPRSANDKDDVVDELRAREEAWFDHYIKGEGAEPQQGATSFTETCPTEAPSGGPYSADSWAAIAPGEVRYRAEGDQTIAADSSTGGEFNPVTSDTCDTASDEDPAGAATYRLDPAPAGGYTLLGAATVIAHYGVGSDTSQIAARLLDVAPDGTKTLVNRGLWRPVQSDGKQVFQLHPNGWTFAEGHVPKLELLAADAAGAVPLLNYGRPSNGQAPITVSDLKLRLPVVERPGSFDGLVGAPAPKVVPAGYELAADFETLGKPRPKVKGRKLEVNGRRALAKVACPAAFVACHDGAVVVTARKKGKGGGRDRLAQGDRYAVAKGGFAEIAGGSTKTVKLKLTGKARRALARKPMLTVRTELRVAEVANAVRGKAKLAKRG